MSRLENAQLRALTEDSVQRTTHRGSVYLGRRTPTAVTVQDQQDWPVSVDFGVIEDPQHVYVGMSIEQALALSEQLAVALAGARIRGIA